MPELHKRDPNGPLLVPFKLTRSRSRETADKAWSTYLLTPGGRCSAS